jgi:uncharacterized protein
MRRADKEVTDPGKLEEIIKKAFVLRIAMLDDPYPYLVPVNFGYRDGEFYFHSAPEGKKVDLIRRNNRICFEVEADCGVLKADSPCKWSTSYGSAVGFGRAVFLADPQDKWRGLEIIFRHYSSDPFEVPLSALDRLAVIKIEVESMTGKISPAS